MKSTIELAKTCGHWSGQTIEMNDVGIQRFSALVRAQALEEAAGVCEERVSYWQRDDNRRDEDESCAAAIRALKEKTWPNCNWPEVWPKKSRT